MVDRDVKKLIYSLHKRSISAKESKTQNKYTRFAVEYHRDNYRVLRLSDVFDIIEQVPTRFRNILSAQGEVLFIENIVSRTLVSAVVRGLKEKEFCIIGDTKYLPYGVGYFSSSFTYGKPIIVVEGAFDRDVLSIIYPNVVAMLSSGLSKVYMEVLRVLTDKLILCYDNDKAGKDSEVQDTRSLYKVGFTVDVLPQFSTYKDPGTIEEVRQRSDVFEHNVAVNYYRNCIDSILSRRSY